jgi:hypothetical protein
MAPRAALLAASASVCRSLVHHFIRRSPCGLLLLVAALLHIVGEGRWRSRVLISGCQPGGERAQPGSLRLPRMLSGSDRTDRMS